MPLYGSGGNNTGVGYNALYYNVSGSNSTAVGYEALYNNANRDRLGGKLDLRNIGVIQRRVAQHGIELVP